MLVLQIGLPTEEDNAAFAEIVNTLAVAGAVTSVVEDEQEELLNEPLAVVEVDQLNIRSGPGTNYNRVGLAGQGDALIVNGQLDNCDWLQDTTVDGIEGWASGKARSFALDLRCADIPTARATGPTAGCPPRPPAARRGAPTAARMQAKAAPPRPAAPSPGCSCSRTSLAPN